MKAFVVMYNRLTVAKKLCEDLVASNCEPILIDNGSKYKPLLDWYKSCPYKVHFVENTGGKSLWNSRVINQYNDDFYIVTDHDLDISEVPKDFPEVLKQAMINNGTLKAGLSLKISDLPYNEYAQLAYEWEKKFWELPKTLDGFYQAPVDTTLAVYNSAMIKQLSFPFDYISNCHELFFNGIRAPKPYECRHLPWYNTKENLTDEEKYYISNIKNDGYWLQKFKILND
jgi:hypothetical protein